MTVRFFTVLKYSAILTLVLVLSSVFTFVAVPERAHAQVGCVLGGAAAGGAAAAGGTAATVAPSGLPVKDVSLNAISAANLTANTVSAANSTVENTVTCILNGLAWTVAKITIQSITRSTVNWINSGFQGSPAFVSDLNENLSYLSDTVANNFFQQLNKVAVTTTGFNLTSPFQDQISQQLRQNYYRSTGSLLGLNQYDLQGHSADPKAFLNGNFSQGGFNAFFSASQNPANNPFGAYMIASNALTNQLTAAVQQRKAELDWGKGFLPWRGNCSTAQAATAAGKTTTITNTATASVNGTVVATASSVPLAKTDACLGSAVRTPGSVIESQLENNLGTGIRQLELADSINEIVGALMGQLVNQVLGSGGLLGASQPSSGGGSSYIDQATNPSQYAAQTGSLAQGVAQTISNDLASLTSYRDAWQKILDAANAAQQACGVRSDITTIITQATAGVARGNTAIQQETAIQTSVQSIAGSTAVDSSTRITSALAQYQSFLGAATTPSATDKAFAISQSTDTSGDASSTPSLYTQAVNEKNSCVART